MKTCIPLSLLALLMSPLLAIAATTADYSGNWVLDKARSKDLPPQYAQVARHRLLNKQDGQSLLVQVDIDTADGPLPSQTFDYRLDGTVTHTRAEVRGAGGKQMVPTTLQAKTDEAGQLHITITRQIPSHSGTRPSASTEDWQLSPDGQTLVVHLSRQGSQFDLFFVRG